MLLLLVYSLALGFSYHQYRQGSHLDRKCPARLVSIAKMRHQAVVGAVIAAVLAYIDIVGCVCVAYLWPYLGLKSFLIAGSTRSKYKSATPAARAGLPALR